MTDMKGQAVRQQFVLHIYQNTLGGFPVFYTVTDRLVFFSIVCNAARRHSLRVIGICIMFDHMHILVEGATRDEARDFVKECLSLFSRAFNKSIGQSGNVFNKAFGSSIKTGLKAIRTACSYLYNNPVEKKLCLRAEENKWNFLAYAISSHPFSEKIRKKKASRALRRTMTMVSVLAKQGKNLKYKWVEKWASLLSGAEKNQLVDYIISSYNCIDYNALISYYGSYELTCRAFASNQGSEYGIKEDYYPNPHTDYIHIGNALLEKHGFSDVKEVLSLPESQRISLKNMLIFEVDASPRMIEKYMHLKPGS